eukprot:COSAG06_NODE_2492_length_6769_cov_2.361619_5_plen_235_part_00
MAVCGSLAPLEPADRENLGAAWAYVIAHRVPYTTYQQIMQSIRGVDTKGSSMAAAAAAVATTTLTPAQLRSFKEEGIVICKGLVPRGITAHWREQIWTTLEASPDSPSTFAQAREHPRLAGAGSEAAPIASPALHELPQIQAIVQQLCDGMVKNVSPDTELIINWGHQGEEGSAAEQRPAAWVAPVDGHLDGYVITKVQQSHFLPHALKVRACFVPGTEATGGAAGTCWQPRAT